MALPIFRASGALAHDIIGVTPAAPAGLATDDIELLVCESMDEAISLATAAGFVEVAGSPISVPSGTATVATRLAVFWRRWNGTDGDPTTNDPGNHIIARRAAFSGCTTSGNAWDITVASSEAVEDTTGSADGGTTTVADCLIVVCIAKAKPDTLGTAEMSSPANTDLATVTERFDGAGNSGNGGWLGMITGEKVAAGAFGATTYTAATASYKAHLVVALKPPSGTTINQTLTATVTTSASMSREVAKTLTASVGTVATMSRQVSKTLTAVVVATPSMTKTVTKTLAAPVTAVASLVADLVPFSAAVQRLRTLLGIGQ